MSIRAKHLTPAAILFASGVLLYGFTLPFPFVFDDYIYLLDNPLVREERSFWFMGDFHAFANHSKRLGLDADLSTNFILRPVAYLTFHLNYLLGGMSPAGFRAVNIVIHCANAVLVFELVSRLLRHGARGVPRSRSTDFAALTSALLFLVHPLQIESVTYIIQRFTSFGTFFYLFTVLMFVVARTSKNDTVARRCRRWSVAGLFAGMLTKEFLFTAPFMIVLIDRLVLGTPLGVAFKRAVPWLLCLPVIPVLMILTSAAQSEGGASLSATLNVAIPKDTAADFSYQYALTQPSVILTYLRLILLPRGLNIDPDHPLSTSLLEWRVLGSLGLIVGIVAASWVWYARRADDPRRAVAFCFVLWFFLTLSIDSSIVPLPDVMSEHRSYLPSIGILSALACIADIVRTRFLYHPRLRLVVPVCMAAWILALGAATFARHQVWRSAVAIWSDTAAKSPNKARPWHNLGTAQFRAGQYPSAAASYRRAIQLRPGYVSAYCNLANTENICGRFREALAVSQAGMRIAPNEHLLHFYSGASYLALGDYSKCLESFKTAIALRADYGPSHVGLAMACTRLGDYDAALKHSQVASRHPLEEMHRRWIGEIEAIVRNRAPGGRAR